MLTRSVKLPLIIIAVSTAMSSPAAAFESTASYSLLKFMDHANSNGMTLHIQVGLISSSFSDCFARVGSTSTVLNLRFLEAQKQVNETAVRSYIDEQYPALPESEKAKLAAVLIDAKRADEQIKGRMASPTLSDEERIMYGQERERLLKKTWEYESRTLDFYYRATKQKKYAEVEHELGMLIPYEDQAISCLIDDECQGTPEAKEATLSEIQNRKDVVVKKLFTSPTEIDLRNEVNNQKFNGGSNDEIQRFTSYMQSLYSKKK